MARIIILRSRSTGGIEPRVERVARALVKRGHDVTVYLWDREGAYPRAETLEDIRVRRLPLPAPYNRPLLLVPMLWWFLAAFRATRNADVVHACDLDTLPAALAAKALRGSLIAYDIFDFYGDMILAELSERIRNGVIRLEASLANFVDFVILPDPSRRESLPEAFPRPVEVVMNTPSDLVLDVAQGETFTIFYGGNLAADRGLLQAIEALQDVEGVELRFAGTGELAKLLRSLSEERDAVVFLGQLGHRELLEESARANAILAWYDPSVPANRVASPNKLFEGMMLSRPVLVSSDTAMAELVSDTGTGLVVGYGDHAALREAVIRLRDDPSKAASLGRRGREAFERSYNWDVNEARLLKAYEDLLSRIV